MASLPVSPCCHSSRGHSDSPAARVGMTVWGRRVVESWAAAWERAGRDGGWSWKEKVGGRATASHLALGLVPVPGLAEEQQLPPLLCLRPGVTAPLPLPWASPAGFLLLQASGLLSVKESDPTFLVPEASQIAPASTVTLKCKTDKICPSLPKAEASRLFQEMLMLVVLLLSDIAVFSAILHAAKSSGEPRSWGMGTCR